MEVEHERANFVRRVLSLPVMTSAMASVFDVYSRTKNGLDTNSLLKFTMGTAENAVKFGAELTVPIIIKLIPLAVDNFACQQLCKLESAYPIITKPPVEIIATSLETINDMKSYSLNKVNKVKSYGYEKVGSVKNYGFNKLELAIAMKDYGMGKATILIGDVGQKMFKTISYTENYIDRYLPPVESEKEKYPESLKPEKGTAKDSLNQAIVLAGKIHHRLEFHATKDLNHLAQRAQNKIEELRAIIYLLKERTTSSIKNYNGFVYNFWSDLHKDNNEILQKWQEQLLHRARVLTKGLTHIFKQASIIKSNISTICLQKIETAKENVDNLYNSFKQISNSELISKLDISINEDIQKLKKFSDVLSNYIQTCELYLPELQRRRIQ